MANNVNQETKKITRKALAGDLYKMLQDAKNAKYGYTDEYKKLVQKMHQFASKVRDRKIKEKEKVVVRNIKDNQIVLLGDMKTLLESIRTGTATQEAEAKLQLQDVELMGSLLTAMNNSYIKTALSQDQELSSLYNDIYKTCFQLQLREQKRIYDQNKKQNQKEIKQTAAHMLMDLLDEDEGNMNYPGVSSLQALVSLPHDPLMLNEKDKLEEYSKKENALADVVNTTNNFAAKICSLHQKDKKTGRTKNVSYGDLKDLKEAYDELLSKVDAYRQLLPEEHPSLAQVTSIAAGLVKERTQVERAMEAVKKYAGSNEKLLESARPFSIYEVEGRINPDFNDGFYQKVQNIKNTGSAFRSCITQWKQDANTVEMLKDYDAMMNAFTKLTDQTIPELMSLDRGTKGYLSAMSPGDLADLRNDYRDAVIAIDQFAKLYGSKIKNEQQREFQAALGTLFGELVDKFRMLDQLVGAEDVKDLPEALDILNQKKEDLEAQKAPKKEKDKKALEKEAQELSEEQRRLKEVGYYQTLANDGQLFPQVLLEPADSERAADLISLRRESQVLEGARKDFKNIMSRNRRMRACPDTEFFDAALAVNPEDPELPQDDKEGFEKHFNDLKQSALELAGEMTVFLSPDQNGKTILLNWAEIDKLQKAYSHLSTEAFMCDGWLPKNDPRRKAFSELEKMCDERVQSLQAAKDYIERNAPEFREIREKDENGEEKAVIPQTRAFSLFELQGGMNPEIDGNALDVVIQFKEDLAGFEESLNKVSNREFAQFGPIRAEYRTFAREIDNLYQNVIPDLLRMDMERGDFSEPMTREKIENARKEFEKATMAFIPMRVDYERRKTKGKPDITKEEEKMFATAQQLYQRVSEKWLAMNYLLDRKGEELMQDVERHNEQVETLHEDLKKYKADQALPAEKRSKDLKLKHNAKFLAWATKLDDLYMNKRLSPAALFEDDPSVGRSQILSQLRLTQQNIMDVQMRAYYLGEQRWEENGTRDLGNVKEFQTHLAHRGQFGTHTVKQYATKGETHVQEIVEKALRNMPEKLRNLQVTYLDEVWEEVPVEEPPKQEAEAPKQGGDANPPKQEDNQPKQEDNQPKQEGDANQPKVEAPQQGQNQPQQGQNQPQQEAKPKTKRVIKIVRRKMSVADTIRSYYNRETQRTWLHKDENIFTDVNNEDVRSYESSGFARAFDENELKENRPLMYFVCDLNRAILNAGCCTDTMYLHGSKTIPDGYNRAYYKIAAQALNNDLALVTDKKGVLVEKTDKKGNKPAANLFPKTELWDDATFQFGEARPDQSFKVVVASTEKDYTEQVPANKEQEFFTTTKNFRSSSFVGYIPQSVTEVPDFSKMTTKELAMAEEDVESFFYNQSAGKNKKPDPFTTAVEDIESYQKAETLADAADLQVMGYLLGKPRFTADQLRIGFKLNEKGKPEVSSILAAESDDDLFSNRAPNDPALVNPDDMMVMTSDMAQKILDWKRGYFSANDRAVMEAFKRLPPQALAAFQARLETMAAKITEAQLRQDEYEDINDPKAQPGEPGLIGLHVKPGTIRILNRQDFNQLKVDDLSVGRNTGDYRTRQTKPPVNIFDAVADLPKQSHLALMDKWAATWCGDTSKTYGHIPDTRSGRRSYERNIHEGKFEREFTEKERDRSLLKMKRMLGDVLRMDRNRKKESFFHWDTGKYTDVLDAQEELDKEIQRFAELRDWDTIAAYREHIQDVRKQLNVNQNFDEEWKKVHEKNQEIRKERKKIQEANSKEKDSSKHKPLPQLLAYPRRKIVSVYDLSADATFKLNDPRRLRPVWKAMLKLRKKLEIYLTARVNPSSEFGQMRYQAMLKMYNDLNDRLAEYITYTGDTRVLPTQAKLEPLPVKNANDKVKYKLVIEPMMETGEWQLRIPAHVREDYIRAVRADILEPLENYEGKDKDKKLLRAQKEADAAEATIRRIHEGALKEYDLNGRKKDATMLDGFEIFDDNDLDVRKARELNAPKLRPVILKNSKKEKLEQQKISVEEQKKRARVEYEKRLKGEPLPGEEFQGGFDFTTMSYQGPKKRAPLPQDNVPKGQKVVVNPPEKKSQVQEMDFNQIMQKVLGEENKKSNNRIENNKAGEIKNNEIKNDNKIENNKAVDNKTGDIKNNDNKIDNKIEDNKNVRGSKANGNNDKVKDKSIDDIFSELRLPEDEPKKIVRPTDTKKNANVNESDPKKISGPTNSKK